MLIKRLLTLLLYAPLLYPLAQKDYISVTADDGKRYIIFIRDLEKALKQYTGTSTTIMLNADEMVNGSSQILVLQKPRIVTIDSHHYLECSITQKTWDTQRESAAQRYRTNRYNPLIGSILGCIGTALPALLFFANGMFDKTARYSDYCCIQKGDRAYCAGVVASATVITYLVFSIINEYEQKQIDYLLNTIIDNPRKIVGFTQIDTTDTTVRIRSDFALDTMNHYPTSQCMHTNQYNRHD